MEKRKSGELSFKMTDCFSYQRGHLLYFQISCNGNRIIFKGNKSPQRKRTPPVKSEPASEKHTDSAKHATSTHILLWNNYALSLPELR